MAVLLLLFVQLCLLLECQVVLARIWMEEFRRGRVDPKLHLAIMICFLDGLAEKI